MLCIDFNRISLCGMSYQLNIIFTFTQYSNIK